MANKLRDIFSNNPPEYKSTLRFQDDASYRSFRTALDAVEKDGNVVPVDGIESISMYLQDHGIRLPINQITGASQFVIGPATEPFKYSVIWDGQEKIYNFRRYKINSGIVLETKKKSVVYLKLVFSENEQKVKITYQIQYQYAKSTNEISYELNACIAFLSKFYAPTKEKGAVQEANEIKSILRYLRYAEGFISRLNAVGCELGLMFSPAQLDSLSDEDQMDIEELYLLLCKKIPLRLNAKVNSTDASNIEITEVQKEPLIGNHIAIVFEREVPYDLLGEQFTIYTANAVINAVVKDIRNDGKKTTVYYGDTDSQPMYIVYTAYLEENLAKVEASRNLSSDSRYIEALPCIQYVTKYLLAAK